MFSLFLYYYWTLHLKIMIYVEKSPRERITTKLMKNTNSQKMQFNLFIYSQKKKPLFVFVFQKRF